MNRIIKIFSIVYVLFFICSIKSNAAIPVPLQPSQLTVAYQMNNEDQQYFQAFYGIDDHAGIVVENWVYANNLNMTSASILYQLNQNLNFKIGVGGSNINQKGTGLLLGCGFIYPTFLKPFDVYGDLNYYNSVAAGDTLYELNVGLRGEIFSHFYLTLSIGYLHSAQGITTSKLGGEYIRPYLGMAWSFNPWHILDYQ